MYRAFATLILCLCLLPRASLAAAPACRAAAEFLRGELAKYGVRPGLKFVPRREVAYPDNLIFKGNTRFEDVDLQIDPDDDVEAIAVMLAGLTGKEAELTKVIKDNVAKGRLDIPVTELVNDRVAELTNEESDCEGPNCHNAVLIWHGLMRRLRLIPAAELLEYLDKYFVLVEPGQSIQFGDVTTILRPDNLVVHTAVVIDDNLVWHKRSRFPGEPWTFQSMDSMIRQPFNVYRGAIRLRFYRNRTRPASFLEMAQAFVRRFTP